MILVLAVVAFGIIIKSSSVEEDWVDEEGKKIGKIVQSIQINYQDGSTGEANTYWIYNQDKIIKNLTYIISAISDTSGTASVNNYQIDVEVIDNYNIINSETFTLEDSSEVFITSEQETKISSYTFSPYDLINYYDVPDGHYSIKITPTGLISWNNKSTNIPSSFEFGVDIVDERAVNIDFN